MIPGGWELIVIVAVLLLLFGAKKLPDMARSIGQSARVFKGEMKGMKGDEESRETAKADPPVVPTPPAVLPPVPKDPPEPQRVPEHGRADTPR